ncbi:MAG: serine/threonine-protein kinase [Acidobacteriota bacterium]
MMPDHWRRIRSILEETLEQEGVAGQAVLDETWNDDRGLRDALSNFLAATATRDEPANRVPAPEVDTAAEDQIGPYRIVQPIAHGGMGTVFLAARDDDTFHRQVAIKVIQAGLGSVAVARRFHSERRILANLDHPYIARLFDGGTTPDGRPYFVMEYVDGIPIDDYCDEHRLTVDDRLRLFSKVCTAVSYAHQNLVVHRDLKPSNILITASGEPKLLDFGIAKVLQPESFGLPIEKTQTGLRPMTPRYASPEQVKGEAIGTASDTYALGVLLYELLINRSPYRLESGLPHEVEWAICEQEPVRPSSELGRARLDQEIGVVAAKRHSRPAELVRRLRGDLDHIVGKALRKDPQDRYGSVEQLAEDLQRHLLSLPVVARRGSFAYRLGKLVRRHRLAFAALAAAGAMTAIFINTLLQQQHRLENEERRSRQSLQFMVDVFRSSEPGALRGETLTAKRILDTGGERVLTELEDQPEIRATLMDAMGQVYLSLGSYDQASDLLEGALELRRELLGSEHLDVAATLYHLAELRYENGEYEPSEAFYREALTIRRRLLGSDHEQVGDTLDGLATVLRWSGKLEGAEEIHLEALEIQRRALGEEHPKVAKSLDGLASLYYRRSEYDRAEELFRQATAIQRRALGDDHPMTMMAYKNVGVVLARRGDLDPALEIFTEAADSLRRSLGAEHPWVAHVLQNLITNWILKGDFQQAEKVARETLAVQEATLDPQHPALIRSLGNLGYIHLQKGELEEAQDVLDTTLAKARQRLGERNIVTAALFRDLASVRLEQGRLEDAEDLFLQSQEIIQAIHHKNHVAIADALLGLGKVAMARRDPGTAEPLFRRGVEIRREAFPDTHWQLAQAEGMLGSSLTALGRFDEAEPLLERRHEEFVRQFGDDHPRAREAERDLAALNEARGRPGL